MRRGTYLNAILTVNAVLLAVLAWTQLVQPTFGPAEAAAQSSPPTGFKNATAQRQEMIKAVKATQASVESLERLLESGRVTVEVGNADDIAASLGGD